MSVPAILCFLLWIVFGGLEIRRFERLKSWAAAMPRSRKVLLGTGLLPFGVIVLFGALMMAVGIQGDLKSGLGIGPWLVIALGGIVFARAQVAGALLLFSLASGAPEAPSND